MNMKTDVDEVLHPIKVKLYPNYLQKGEGHYIARTNNYASLTIEQVCAVLKKRGGFTGNYKELIEHVSQFFDEAAYQLCVGFGINTGYFSIQPKIKGTFSSATEVHDPKKHKLGFNFRVLGPLQRLTKDFTLEVAGFGGQSGWIDEFIDVEEDMVNSEYTPGHQFCILGHKIKIAGDDEVCGVFFVPEDDPSRAVKVKHLAENGKSKLIGIAPCTGFESNRLEIRTQYTGSGSTFAKNPHIIKSSFLLGAVKKQYG